MNRIPKDKSPEKTFNKRIGTKILKEMLIRMIPEDTCLRLAFTAAAWRLPLVHEMIPLHNLEKGKTWLARNSWASRLSTSHGTSEAVSRQEWWKTRETEPQALTRWPREPWEGRWRRREDTNRLSPLLFSQVSSRGHQWCYGCVWSCCQAFTFPGSSKLGHNRSMPLVSLLKTNDWLTKELWERKRPERV